KPRLANKEVRDLVDWVGGGLKAADARRAAEGRVVLRRLNRVEYDNTVRDLLGVDIELKELLPLDGSAGGFDNVGEALHVSSGFQSNGKPVTYRVDAGQMGMAGKSHLIGYFDAPADKPAVVEFVEHLEARSTIRLLPYGLASAQAVHKIGADNYEGPGLAVQW